MKKARRYFVTLIILLLLFVGGMTLFLLVPPLSERIADRPRNAPVPLIANSENKGQRCEDKAYCFDASYCDPDFTIDPHCAGLQRKLVEAAEANDVAAAGSAVAMGANVNGSGLATGAEWWIRPIHPAAWKGNTDVVKFLLDNGADVNDVYVCCMSSKTPLMEAVERDHLETARLLIARGADVNFKGIEEWTALRIAEQKGNEKMIALLDRAGAMSLPHRAERRLIKLYLTNPRTHRYRFPD